jgi:hypothetical protein
LTPVDELRRDKVIEQGERRRGDGVDEEVSGLRNIWRTDVGLSNPISDSIRREEMSSASEKTSKQAASKQETSNQEKPIAPSVHLKL